MILPVLAMALPFSAVQAAPNDPRGSAAQDAPVTTVADALARLNVGDKTGPKPAVSPGQWVTNDDYPAVAIRRGEQGTVAFSLDVDATGQVTGCSVTATSGSTVLDETTCQLMRTRASFEPARDAKGTAIAARWSSRFRWELPPAPPLWNLEKPLAAHLSFDVAPDGSVSNCALKAEGAPTPPPPLCPSIEKAPLLLLDYLRSGSKTPVTIAADFTFALQGAAPAPFHVPRPGVVTFAHLNFEAEATPMGRPHCLMEGSWGDYKGRLEFPCPRDLRKDLEGIPPLFRMAVTLGSSGPAPDPEGLGTLVKLIKASAAPGTKEERAPGGPETDPALPRSAPKAASAPPVRPSRPGA